MLHPAFLEGECHKIEGGEGLCIARPRRLGITEFDKLYLSCLVTGIKVVVLI